MKFDNIYDVMSFLDDKENYKNSIEFVLNKLYEEVIEAQNNNDFLPMFMNDPKYFSINIDINKFTYYLYQSFIKNENIERSEFLNKDFLNTVRASFTSLKKDSIYTKYKKIFWIIFLGYEKGLIYVSSVIKNLYFTSIIFKNNSGKIAKMLAINISTAHLYKFFPEELEKITRIDYKNFQTSEAFGIRKVAEFESKLEEKPKVLMAL